MSTLTLTNIPAEIYAAALEYELIELWDNNLSRAQECYRAETEKRGWTDDGLERALSDYFLRRGNFADGEIYEDISGYSH
jgi:hypothetical protein